MGKLPHKTKTFLNLVIIVCREKLIVYFKAWFIREWILLYEASELKSDGAVGDAPRKMVQTDNREEAKLMTT